MNNTLLIYNQLSASGVSHAGALGLMGNWMAESGLEPWRLQNDFTAGRTLSHAYTADVMAGRISRTQFARDQKGYGLAQWTYFNFSTGQGRKLDLYDFWKKSGKALDDASMQVAFALHELQTEGQYSGLWRILQTTDDIYSAANKVCRLYEQPYYCNVDVRFRYALSLAQEISAASSIRNAIKTEEEPIVSGSSSERTSSGVNELSSSLTEANDTELVRTIWPPRMVDKSMSGKDVTVLQAILDARGYKTDTDGVIGEATDQAIRQFQREHDLDPDGVVGPLTWRKILSMED